MAKEKPTPITNVALLDEEIKASKIPPTMLAALWGMTMPTYYSRIYGRTEFTASEIVKATKTLKLSMRKRDLIFLTASVN